MSDKLTIEVVYALPDQQVVIPLTVDDDTNIEQAILASGILTQFPEIDLTQNRVGIYSRLAKLSDGLLDGDRIEIYRPLLEDPREIRRRRAKEQAEKQKAEQNTK